MKTLLIVLSMTMFIGQLSAQDTSKNVTAADATKELITRIAALEKSIEETQIATDISQATNTREKYKSSLSVIRLGLENGTRIEDILPSSMRLLALADVTTVLTDLNNPTSTTLGSSFTDMTIAAAANNLLPKSPDNLVENQKVENRFKSIMGAIINNPVVQALANSNPISGTINTVIQQAGLFQSRASVVQLTEKQIKDKKDIFLAVDFKNPNGPAFDEPQLKIFYAEIKDRVDFYVELNKLNSKHADTIKQLQIDARVIKKGIKASKTEICNLLGIPSKDYSQSIDSRYDVQDVNVMKTFLKDPKFTKALSLSGYAQDQLPDVLEFNESVVSAISNYIDDYINILEKYKNVASVNFKANDVDKTINILKVHKKTFSPIKM